MSAAGSPAKSLAAARETAAGRWGPIWAALAGLSLSLLLVVGASQPHAAAPDLGEQGWAPGQLIPLTLGPAAVSAVLATAYVIGALALLVGLRSRPRPLPWAVPAVLGALALLTAPFGSADHLHYLAYGQILIEGGDPWSQSPIEWQGGADPITSRVEAPWTTQPSVYGPFATLVHAACALVAHDNLRVGMWVWQIVCVASWLGVRALLRSHLPAAQHSRVDVLWTFNPLLVGIGVLGAHLDVLATALVVVSLCAWGRGGLGWAVFGGFALAAAESTKFTYAVAAVAVVLIGWRRRRELVGFISGALAGVFALHGWAGLDSYIQILRSGQTVSLAMPWRPLLEAMLAVGLPNWAARTAISAGAAALAIVLADIFIRLTRAAAPGARELWLTAMLTAAFAFSASYSLPWYDPLVWAGLAATLPSALDLLATARLTVIAIAYVPGRVTGMTPGVEQVTLGLRRYVAPVLILAVWIAALRAGRSAEGAVGASGHGGLRGLWPPPARRDGAVAPEER